MRLFISTLAAFWLALPAIAGAQTETIGFQSPSHNIFCQLFPAMADSPATMRCDIMEANVTAPRSRDCDLEYGKGFEVSANGRAERICYGDTVADRTMPVLAYGATWQRSGFTCSSEQSGVTCFNAARHGFSISRAKQSLF